MHRKETISRRRRRHEVLDSSSDEEEGSSIKMENASNISGVEILNDDNNCNSSSSSSDDNEEIMNPYIMNPFSSNSNHNNDNNNSVDVYSSQALLPPSVEMASFESNNNVNSKVNSVLNNDRVGEKGGEILGIKLGLANIREHGGQQGLKKPIQQQRTPLTGFDPYAMNNNQQQQQQLEMEEEEESIEFLSPTKQQTLQKEKKNVDFNNIFGPLLNNETNSTPSSPHHKSQEETTTSFASSTFSPFPKHRTWNNDGYNNNNEYGENTPLSGNSHQRRSTYNIERGAGGIISTIKSISSTVAYTISTFYYGRHPYSRPNMYPNNNNNPFSNRMNIRMSHHRGRNKWGIKSYLRLLGIITTLLFCIGTLIVIRNVPSVNDSNDNSNIEIVNKRAYQNISVEGGGSSTVTTGVEEGGEGINNNNDNDASSNKSIVLKKMKKAKQHWWNRNKNNVQADNTNEVHTEVYHNGQKEEPSSASATEQQGQQGNKDSSANESSLPAGVIVQTQEDGTVLIKLPPPRMNLKEPKHLGSSTGGSSSSSAVVQDLKPLGSSTSTSVKEEKPAPFVGDIDNGDTVYIKLPYQQQQNQQHRTLTEQKGTRQELEPPLRGAAPQLHNNHHQFHHPPLLPFTDSGTHKEEVHDHPNMIHALRQDFNTWMDKHGKNYGSHEEKEHRFSVWRKNHVR